MSIDKTRLAKKLLANYRKARKEIAPRHARGYAVANTYKTDRDWGAHLDKYKKYWKPK